MNLDRAALVRREIEGRRRFGGGHGGGQERSDLRAVAGDIIDRQMKFFIEAEAADHIDLLGHDRRHVDLRPRALTHAYNRAAWLDDIERRDGGSCAAGGLEDDVEGSLALGMAREAIGLSGDVD